MGLTLRSFTLLLESIDRVQSTRLLDQAMTIRAAFHAESKDFRQELSRMQMRASPPLEEGVKAERVLSDKERLKRDLAAGLFGPAKRS